MRFPSESERAKRAKLLEMLDESMVMVHVDARLDGVDVPEHLADDPMLALNLSHKFGLDVFEVGPFAVKASLTFGDEAHLCVLPWPAIWSMTAHVGGQRFVFPDAVPPELMAAAQQAAEAFDAMAEADEALPDMVESIADDPLADLTSAPPAEAEPEADEATEAELPEPTPAPRGRPTLRIVK